MRKRRRGVFCLKAKLCLPILSLKNFTIVQLNLFLSQWKIFLKKGTVNLRTIKAQYLINFKPQQLREQKETLQIVENGQTNICFKHLTLFNWEQYYNTLFNPSAKLIYRALLMVLWQFVNIWLRIVCLLGLENFYTSNII